MSSQLQNSLRNATLELSLERSKHSVEAVVKDEEIRKLRVAQCLLQDDNSDLHEQLEDEQARSDELEASLEEALAQLDEQRAEAEAAQNTIRTQAREVANLKVSTSGLPINALLAYTPSGRAQGYGERHIRLQQDPLRQTRPFPRNLIITP